ncbi:hypothetical protein K1T35_18600 [Pseudonocardia sp. DSM 110487]|uniref:carboxyl transferase domain-containing protein n=1 Tax=Pseudonocardia sp. DSM 110487 TaxID=2865833 RepID=UPI001C6974D9|nr:carboxyl transferase domain-containing protein [Pseudonocardia sp. DSM 110487]QYN39026.1 hypothetical protein K1T35_18600 [Pseudonocardia sp. DSM 110487]
MEAKRPSGDGIVTADLSFAWPINQIAVMGADAAADVIFRKAIAPDERELAALITVLAALRAHARW